jgi:hypothetical protein
MASLHREDPEMAAVVKKWMPKIGNLVHSLMQSTGESEEDCQQGLLLKIVFDIKSYRLHQVRYTPPGKVRQLWEVIETFEDAYLVRRKDEMLLLSKSVVEHFEKCSMSSFVYTGMIQHLSEQFSRRFSERRGFKKRTKEDSEMVFSRAHRRMVSTTRGRYQRVYSEAPARELFDDDGSSLTELDLAASPEWANPEEQLAQRELHTYLESKLPRDVLDALAFMAEGAFDADELNAVLAEDIDPRAQVARMLSVDDGSDPRYGVGLQRRAREAALEAIPNVYAPRAMTEVERRTRNAHIIDDMFER